MKKLIFILLSVMFAAQAQIPSRIFNSGTAVFPSDSTFKVFYVYSISHNNIVFAREGELFSAGFDISVEIYNGQTLIERLIDSKQVEVNTYTQTIDRKRQLKGMVTANLQEGSYTLHTLVTDKNSGRELRLPPENLILHKEDIRTPLVAGSTIECDGGKFPVYINLNGDIPFTDSPVELIISVPPSNDSVSIIISNNGKTVFSSKNLDKFNSALSLRSCGGEVVIETGGGGEVTDNILIKNLNKFLEEGVYNIEVVSGNKKAVFAGRVLWVDKPVSLLDPESAIKLLRFLEDEDKIKGLLKNDDSDYKQALEDYWKKYDPTRDTPFNPILEEYYGRIDYAGREFKPLGKTNGIETDRAEVYIKLGKPDKIERTSNGRGKVVETWYYDKASKKFIFIDNEGTGNYILQSN